MNEFQRDLRGDAFDESGASGGRFRTEKPKRASVLIIIFLLSLMVPLNFELFGALRLSPYRLIVVLMFLPVLIKYMSGGAGEFRRIDLLVVMYVVWSSLALFKSHGLGQWQFIGMNVAETLGPYLLARCYVRDHRDFEAFGRVYVFLVLLMLPFLIIENFAGFNIFREFVEAATGRTLQTDSGGQRLGLDRAQGPFQHPILLGVFCAPAAAYLFYVLGRDWGMVKRGGATGLTLWATFSSLSMGALISFITQMALVAWDRISKGRPKRWNLLLILVIGGYIALDMVSNRSPVQIIVDEFTFNRQSGWNRIHIFDHGMNNVWRNPLFGIGLRDWDRPHWMLVSIDNFWLVVAMRYGIPGFLFLAGAIVLLFIQVGRAGVGNQGILPYQKATLIALTGICVAMCTVHIWGSIYCFFFFMLGSAVWMLDKAELDDLAESKEQRRARLAELKARQEERNTFKAVSAPLSGRRESRPWARPDLTLAEIEAAKEAEREGDGAGGPAGTTSRGRLARRPDGPATRGFAAAASQARAKSVFTGRKPSSAASTSGPAPEPERKGPIMPSQGGPRLILPRGRTPQGTDTARGPDPDRPTPKPGPGAGRRPR